MIPDLARELRERFGDVQIDVVTSRNVYRGACDVLPRSEVWKGIRIIRLWTPKSNQGSMARRLLAGTAFAVVASARMLTLPWYDVVFVGTNPPAAPIAASVVARARKARYVYLIHDLFPDVAVAVGALPSNGWMTTACRRAQRRWLNGATRVVAIGRCMRDYLTNVYGLPQERVAVIPNWSDPCSVPYLPRDTQFRAKHGFTGFLVLYAGNFGQHQDFDTLLDAALLLRDDDSRISFAFVGDGTKREELERRIVSDGLTNVYLFPFVSLGEFADLLASADASLVTLEPGAEGLGVPSKFYNILASGRPTIAVVPPTSEVARVIEEEGCGIRVDQRDAAALASAIRSLASAPEEAQAMGKRARSALERRFTLAQVAEQFHQVFLEAAEAGRKGRR